MDTIFAVIFGMLMYAFYLACETKRILQTATIFLWLACISTAVGIVVELNHAYHTSKNMAGSSISSSHEAENARRIQ